MMLTRMRTGDNAMVDRHVMKLKLRKSRTDYRIICKRIKLGKDELASAQRWLTTVTPYKCTIAELQQSNLHRVMQPVDDPLILYFIAMNLRFFNRSTWMQGIYLFWKQSLAPAGPRVIVNTPVLTFQLCVWLAYINTDYVDDYENRVDAHLATQKRKELTYEGAIECHSKKAYLSIIDIKDEVKFDRLVITTFKDIFNYSIGLGYEYENEVLPAAMVDIVGVLPWN
jgi:hypothetical protein